MKLNCLLFTNKFFNNFPTRYFLQIFFKYPVCLSFSICLVQERVEALNEKLDLVLSGGEKLTDGELSAEGGPTKPGYSKKQCKLIIWLLSKVTE